MRRAAGVVLMRVAVTLRRIGCPREGRVVLAGVAQMRIGVASHQAKIQIFADIHLKLRGGRQIVVVVIDAPFTGRQQIQGCYRSRSGMEVFDIRRVMKTVAGAAESRRLIEGVERAALEPNDATQGSGASAGDDVDDSADCVRPVQSALRSAQYLDTLDILGEHLPEIE